VARRTGVEQSRGGFVVSADYAKPDDKYGGGTAWGARLSVGLGTATFTIGAASWEGLTSIGGNVAIQLIGGTLLPIPSPGIRANVQVGVFGVGAQVTP